VVLAVYVSDRGHIESGRIGMLELYTKLQARLAQEDGQTMAEYAVVLAVIAIGIFVALGALSGSVSGALSRVTSDI
jgi:Flp pilus assembly pilin Flp